MGAAGFDVNFEQAEFTVGSVAAFKHAPVRDSVAAVGAARRHPHAANDVAGDGQVDRAGVFLHPAVHECEVNLAQAAAGKHLAQLAMGAVVLGDDDEAAGSLVEAVNDAGAQVASGMRKLFAEVEEQRVH